MPEKYRLSYICDAGKKRNRTNFLLLGFLVTVVPFLQLGFSYYLSAQIFGVLVLSLMVALMGIQRRSALFAVFGAALFSLKVFVELFSFDVRELLVVMREAFCFILLVISVRQISYLAHPVMLRRYYVVFLSVCFVLICLQYLSILHGKFIQFPTDWFVMNEKTLLGVDEALEHGTRIRPVGFYGEPSYMAFVMVSALVTFLSLESRIAKMIPILVVNILAFVLLGSLSGILACLIVGFVSIFTCSGYFSSKRILPRFLFGGFAIGVAFAAILFFSGSAERLSSLFSKGDLDPSIFIRFVAPVMKLSSMVDDARIFGFSSDELISVDNSFFHLLLHYGIVAPVLFFVLAIYIRSFFLVLYLSLALNFNGAYFSYDKVVVMSLTLGLSLGALLHRK